MPPTFLVARASETPEFILLFMSPGCAIQPPKRALATAGDETRVRDVLHRTLGDRAELESTVSTAWRLADGSWQADKRGRLGPHSL